MDSMQKEYTILDYIKFTASILIILSHTEPLKFNSIVLNLMISQDLGRLAVAMFFTMSGFLFVRQGRLTFKKPLRRLFTLYLAWSLIYLPARLIEYHDNLLPWTANFLSYLQDFFTGYYHLWFFTALLQSMLLLCLLNKILSLRRIFILSLILHLISLTVASFLFSSDDLGWYYNACFRSGPLYGFFYFMLGTRLRTTAWLPKRPCLPALGLLIGTFSLIGESCFTYYHLHHTSDMYLSNILIVPCLFLLLRQKDFLPQLPSRHALTLRKYSILLYGIHPWFHYICLVTSFNTLLNKTFSHETILPAIFCIVLTASLLASALLLKLEKPFPILTRLH